MKILSRNRIKEEKMVEYHVGPAFFTKSTLDLEVFPHALPEWLIDPYPPGAVYRKTLNLYRNFQYIESFKVIQWFVTIVGSHFQWLEFDMKSHGTVGKQCAFLPKRLEKISFF